MQDEKERMLDGGRLTKNITKKGCLVYRPVKESSPFVHRVLRFLEEKDCGIAPRLYGIDSQGREILDYIDGDVPVAPFYPTEKQCCEAAVMIRTLHDALAEFPDCGRGQTVCHNDLHPSNFVFQNGVPIAVFDWDMAAVGDPLYDLAFAIWMWINVDDDQQEVEFQAEVYKMHRMLDAYGLPRDQIPSLCEHMLRRMRDVGNCVFSTEKKMQEIKAWAENCQQWVHRYKGVSGIS